ncbi:MAG: 2-hydroxyacyl-CoA dehydratase family protein [Candidatus Helarchaeota archaeon]
MINHQIEDFKFQSILDLGIQYLLGKLQIQTARKQGKKIVAGFLPPMELIFAAKNTLPLFLPRLTEFPFSQYIPIVNIFNRFHILKYIIRFYIHNRERFSIGYFDSINQSEFSKIFTSLVNVAERANYYMDTCVQTRICYGAMVKNFHLIDLIVGGLEGNYCLHFAKFYERMGNFRPVFYFEKPFGDASNPELVDMVISELHRFIATLENLSGESITNSRIRKIAEINNEIRGYIRELYTYYIKGYVPLHTAALLLIHGAYVDFLSDAKFFRDRLRNLVLEIRRKSKWLANYQKEGIHRVIIAGSPGFDPILPSTFENNNAVLLYLDLFESCLRYPSITTSGDMIKNYANYLLEVNIKEGIQDLIDLWIGIAKRIKADAILFSHVWGCRFTTPAYRKMKDLVMEKLGIPIMPLDFYTPGENIGQVQTRIGAFIEMLK